MAQELRILFENTNTKYQTNVSELKKIINKLTSRINTLENFLKHSQNIEDRLSQVEFSILNHNTRINLMTSSSSNPSTMDLNKVKTIIMNHFTAINNQVATMTQFAKALSKAITDQLHAGAPAFAEWLYNNMKCVYYCHCQCANTIPPQLPTHIHHQGSGGLLPPPPARPPSPPPPSPTPL